MPANPLHNRDLFDRIKSLENEIRELKGTRIKNSTIDQGFIQVKDDNGTIRAKFGLQADGKYGLRVWNSVGTQVHDFTTT